MASVTMGGATAQVSYTAEKSNAIVMRSPTAIDGLVYNGSPQQLVSAGMPLGGTMTVSFDGNGGTSKMTAQTFDGN